MAGKPGTLLGRTLLKFIPEASPFHKVAEAADLGAEAIIFDSKKEAEVPVLEHTDTVDFVDKAKHLLLALAEKGVIAINYPLVDGDNEKQVEDGIMDVLTGYINEVTD